MVLKELHKAIQREVPLYDIWQQSKDAIVAIGESTIKDSEYEKLLGVIFDKKLNFKKHVQDLCKKAHQKLHVLAQLSNYLDPIKLQLPMDALMKLRLNYCPLL